MEIFPNPVSEIFVTKNVQKLSQTTFKQDTFSKNVSEKKSTSWWKSRVFDGKKSIFCQKKVDFLMEEVD